MSLPGITVMEADAMEKILKCITNVAMAIASALFIIVLLFVIANVLGRRVFDIPLKPTMEIVQYGMLTAVCLALSKTTLLKRHIAVTVLLDKFPRKVRDIIQAIEWLCCACVFGVLSYSFVDRIKTAIAMGKKTDLLKIPYQYLYLIMTILIAISALIFLYLAVQAVVDICKKPAAEPAEPNITDEGSGQEG